jgi:hypothetical protein
LSRVQVPFPAPKKGMPGGIAKWLRQRSAKPLFTSSNLVAASTFNNFKELARKVDSFFFFYMKGGRCWPA